MKHKISIGMMICIILLSIIVIAGLFMFIAKIGLFPGFIIRDNMCPYYTNNSYSNVNAVRNECQNTYSYTCGDVYQEGSKWSVKCEICTNGNYRCHVGSNAVQECVNHKWSTILTCKTNYKCTMVNGYGRCVDQSPPACTNGKYQCRSTLAVQECKNEAWVDILVCKTNYKCVMVNGYGKCIELTPPPPPSPPTCYDGIKNQDETDIDCGGTICQTCSVPPEPPTEETCYDGVMNQDETGVDCGGSCQACSAPGTCTEFYKLENNKCTFGGEVCDGNWQTNYYTTKAGCEANLPPAPDITWLWIVLGIFGGMIVMGGMVGIIWLIIKAIKK